MVAAAGSKSGRIWDVATGKVKLTFDGRFALSPDGKTLALTRADGSIQLWDATSNKALVKLKGHNGSVFTMAFSPDTKMLASGPFAGGMKGNGDDKSIKIWDVATGEERAVLAGHRKGIYYLMFAPDGKTLLATDFDGSMKLWDVKHARVLATLGRVKIGERIQGTPVGYWAVAADLKTWAVGANKDVQVLDIADFTRVAHPEAPSGKKSADPLQEARERSKANLKTIAKAFEKYEEANQHLPIGLIDPSTGMQGLSWRVQILPYLGDPDAARLFKQFRLDESWDSEHNRTLLAKMPKVYAAVSGRTRDGFTFCQGFADHMLEAKGEKWPKDGSVPFGQAGAFFPDPRMRTFLGAGEKPMPEIGLPNRSRKVMHVSDGTANTFLMAEAGESVPWTKPQDIHFRRELKKPVAGMCSNLGGLFNGDFHVVMVDGTIHYIKKEVPAEKLRPFITFAGAERPDFFSVGLEPPDWAETKPFIGTWLRISFEENGKKQPFDENSKYTLKFTRDNKVTYSENATVLFEGEFFTFGDLAKAPKKARWDWKPDITDLVIYSFEGNDKLTTCWTHEKDAEWPIRFATGTPKGGAYLAVWRRLP
jgi:uncharacterized protein (TIGR03067 family)